MRKVIEEEEKLKEVIEEEVRRKKALVEEVKRKKALEERRRKRRKRRKKDLRIGKLPLSIVNAKTTQTGTFHSFSTTRNGSAQPCHTRRAFWKVNCMR